MRNKCSSIVSLALVLLASSALLLNDAQAKRLGGGSSFGRQSFNIGRSPSTSAPTAPVMRNTAPNTAGSPAASTASRASSANQAQPRSGFSRFLGPIAGIAAGLGIAALLSSLGLSGAFLDMMSSLALVLLVFFGVRFLLRRLRGTPQAAGATAGAGVFRTSQPQHESAKPLYPRTEPVNHPHDTANSFGNANIISSSDQPSSVVEEDSASNWFIPEGFDSHAFLQEAKKQFVFIQSLWGKGDLEQLKQYMTDDLAKELTPQILAQSGNDRTEVLLLNAELLGMEKIQDAGFDGHLASVRFSGMIREEENQAAFRFEEVWNLYKTDSSGWLLAGIQQIPVQDE